MKKFLLTIAVLLFAIPSVCFAETNYRPFFSICIDAKNDLAAEASTIKGRYKNIDSIDPDSYTVYLYYAAKESYLKAAGKTSKIADFLELNLQTKSTLSKDDLTFYSSLITELKDELVEFRNYKALLLPKPKPLASKPAASIRYASTPVSVVSETGSSGLDVSIDVMENKFKITFDVIKLWETYKNLKKAERADFLKWVREKFQYQKWDTI